MSLEPVQAFFAQHAPDIDVLITEVSSARVALAVAAHSVEPVSLEGLKGPSQMSPTNAFPMKMGSRETTLVCSFNRRVRWFIPPCLPDWTCSHLPVGLKIIRFQN